MFFISASTTEPDLVTALASLEEQFKRDFPADVMVRGILYPGVVIESHGYTYTPTVEKHLMEGQMAHSLKKYGRETVVTVRELE